LEEEEEKEAKAGVDGEVFVKAEIQKSLGQADFLLTAFALVVV